MIGGKPSAFSGAQEAWRDWSTVLTGYAGAAVPRLHKLMDDAAKAAAPIPNATILEDDDRAASAQLKWMMLMICMGAALNTVFLAGDSKGQARSLLAVCSVPAHSAVPHSAWSNPPAQS